jgi:chemotaxis response regulator CheB
MHIVAIGASADGIRAISNLLQDFPTTLKAAVLVVQHRHPDYPSSLRRLTEHKLSPKVAS